MSDVHRTSGEMILSMFCTFKAGARAKPAKSEEMVGSTKETSASRLLANPNRTDKMGTNNAVIVTLTASVSHKMATHGSKDNRLFGACSRGRV